MIQNNLRYHEYRQAVAMSRYWWNRYHDLPRWRFLARRNALAQAVAWAEKAKSIHEQ